MILMSIGEFLQTAEGIISLITSLVGLIGTGVGAFFAIKGWIKAFAEKDNKQKWALIMEIADAAMREVEKSAAEGKEKKELVINAVKEGCKAAGIDVGPFIDQLVAYIDNCIEWYNGMADSTKVAKKVAKK